MINLKQTLRQSHQGVDCTGHATRHMSRLWSLGSSGLGSHNTSCAQRFILLLSLLVMGIGQMWADTTYEWDATGTISYSNKLTVTPANTSGSVSYWTGYNFGTDLTKAVKMESATTITFSVNTGKTATVTIGISTKNNTNVTASKANVKFDGTATSNIITSDQTAADGTYTYKAIDITNVAAGSHTISRGGGEMGVYYIKVVETDAPTTYTVSYDLQGHGSAIDAATGVTAIPSTLPTPTADCYTFGGWWNTSACTGTQYSGGESISANTTLYAKWTETPTYTISYNMKGHGKQITAMEGQTAFSFANLQQVGNADGYYFDGWYTDEGLTNAAVRTTNLTQNTTLYAKWTQYTAYNYITVNNASELTTALSNAEGGSVRTVIYLKNGTYDYETSLGPKISKDNVSLIGESQDGVIITTKITNTTSSNTGNSSGSYALMIDQYKNIYLENLTVQNTIGTAGIGCAIYDCGTNTIMKNVTMDSFQDTYTTTKGDKQRYLKNCTIKGGTDFICGPGLVFFDGCTLVTKANGENTAWITANSSTYNYFTKEMGYVFYGCTIENNAPKFSFGRAWSDYPMVAFINTKVKLNTGSLIDTRWTTGGMKAAAYKFCEYGTYGDISCPSTNEQSFTYGSTTNKMETILTAEQAAQYTLANVFPNWISYNYHESALGTHDNGTVTILPTLTSEGEQVGLIETPDDSYTFSGWNVATADVTASDDEDAPYKYTMPASDVTVNATFSAAGETIGSSTAPYNTAFTTKRTISKGKTRHITFHNEGTTGANWNNWILVANVTGKTKIGTSAETYTALRADQYDLIHNTSGDNTTRLITCVDGSGNTVDAWTNFQSDMTNADVAIDITYSGTRFYMKAISTASSGRIYTYTAETPSLTDATSADLYLSCEKATLSNIIFGNETDACTVEAVAGDNGTVALTNSNGMSVTSGTAVQSGESITFKATPNEGYTFAQWNEGTTTSSVTKTISEATSLTASWAKKQKFSMTNVTGPTTTIKSGNTASVEATISGGTATIYNGRSSDISMVSENCVQLGGSSGSYLLISLTDETLQEGDIITIGQAAQFKISNTNSNKTTVSTNASTGTYTVTASDILVGKSSIYIWKDKGASIFSVTITHPAKYTVTYNLNGGYGTAPAQEEIGEGKTFNLAYHTGIFNSGYAFAGWNDGTKTYSAGAEYTMGTADVTFTAQWTEGGTVEYDLNGGTTLENAVPSKTDCAKGATFTVAQSSPVTRDGYVFGGWSDGATTYNAGDTYTMGTSNVILTAQWTEGLTVSIADVVMSSTDAEQAQPTIIVKNGANTITDGYSVEYAITYPSVGGTNVTASGSTLTVSKNSGLWLAGTSPVTATVTYGSLTATTTFQYIVKQACASDDNIYAVAKTTSTPSIGKIISTTSGDCKMVYGGWMFAAKTKPVDGTKTYGNSGDTWGDSKTPNTGTSLDKFPYAIGPGSNFNCPYDEYGVAPEVKNAKPGQQIRFASPIFQCPTEGGFIVFTPKVNGTVTAHIIQSGMFVSSDGTCNYNETRRVMCMDDANQTVRMSAVIDQTNNPLPDLTITDYQDNSNPKHITKEYATSNVKAHYKAAPTFVYNAEPGHENEVIGIQYPGQPAQSYENGIFEYDRDYQGYGWASFASTPATYVFHVRAGKSYYLFQYGANISFSGYEFVADASQKTDDITLDQASSTAITATAAGHQATVSCNRPFTPGIWNAAVLPFSLNSQMVSEIFGQVRDKDHTDATNTEILYFQKVENKVIYFRRHAYNNIVAGIPFLIKPAEDSSTPITINTNGKTYPYVTIERTDCDKVGMYASSADWYWTGSYAPFKIALGNYFISSSSGNVVRYNPTNTSEPLSSNGFRSYLCAKNSEVASAAKFTVAIMDFEEDENNPTYIGTVELNDDGTLNFINDNKVFDINGHVVGEDPSCINSLPAGIYICNGKKYMVK